ncbi:hypothetical protein CHS0354_029848 [Potamilus streckersoni]|uniref:Enkurin domain-containing protein n=1 Tax=Potamilus streckersoni TaxID=2493646 RepID=A0AAE0WD35_9BIVA|nr:hypothetical protein CHS0354_029848 [Potamilus streckersoni]
MQGLTMQLTGHGYGMPRQYHQTDVKDHFKENVRRLRQIQRRRQEQEFESQKPVKALWKSEKYKDIGSKIKEEIEQDEPLPPRPKSATFLRAHSRAGPPVKLVTRSITPDPKLSVPPASTANDVKLVRHDFDFIKINGISAKHIKIPRAPSLTALDDLKKKDEETLKEYRRGQVPNYLKMRQMQWKHEEEERIANTPDPTCPVGHRVLPENERRETLELLQKNQQDVIKQLQSLPLRTDTFRIRTCKQEFEKKLAEIDEAIKIFSRPKVFVKLDQ